MITSSEHLNNLIAHAYSRELEVYAYQTNIDNYVTMLSALPSDNIPERLAAYANVDITSLPVDLSEEDVMLIADYQYRDRLRSLVRTEKVEQSKAKRILDSLKLQIGAGADSKIAAYKASLPTQSA